MRSFFCFFRARGQMFFFQFACRLCVLPLFVRKLIQQFPRRSVRRAAGSFVIKTLRLQLHQFRLLPCHLHAQRPHQPHGSSLQESFYVFPPDQWNVFPEALAEHLNQPVAVHRLLFPHFFQHLCPRPIFVPHPTPQLPANPPPLPSPPPP